LREAELSAGAFEELRLELVRLDLFVDLPHVTVLVLGGVRIHREPPRAPRRG
jgi:hypothetical protein